MKQHMASAAPAPREALGQSESFLLFQEKLSRVATVDRPVLLIGERGTGKELAAGRLHFLSHRWEGPFVTLNCAALTSTLIESELFGHERGAFTGAENRRAGRFEAADGGTLFLDEIGNIPIETQEKILRVVEYGCFERVGSADSIDVDVRIVGATNADLPELARKGEFKQDFLDRLSFEVLFLPPLRYREEDILLLAHHFGGRMSYELGRDYPPEFSHEAVKAMENYRWPGNVRELKNVVERAVYSMEGDEVDSIVFDPFISPFENVQKEEPVQTESQADPDLSVSLPASNLKDAVAELEISMLSTALQQKKYNQKNAARSLGLSYDQLRGMIRKYGHKKLGIE